MKRILSVLAILIVFLSLPLSAYGNVSGIEEQSAATQEMEQETPDEEPVKPVAARITDYWWVLPIAATLLGMCVIIVLRRKPSHQVQPDGPVRPSILGIGNMHHIGARESQQDSFVISDISNTDLCMRKGVLGVVADGMGGLADGGEISVIVTRTMLQYFNEVNASGQPELDLLNMLQAANDQVNHFLKGRDRGGSTVVSVIILHGQLYWIAVGDSRIYLIRNGAILQINREHVYAVELDEKAATGEISWGDAANDPQRGALTNYLGMGKLEKVDRNIRPMQLLPGDRILLMSDGVFGVLSDEEILEAMTLEPFQSATELQKKVLAKKRPNQDNLTAIIFEYKS